MALDVRRIDLQLDVDQDIDQITNRSVLSRAFGDNAVNTALTTTKIVSICVMIALIMGTYLGTRAIADRYNMEAQKIAIENNEYKRTISNLAMEESRLRNINRVDGTIREVAQFSYPTGKDSIIIASNEFAPVVSDVKKEEVASGKNMLSSLLKSPSKD